MQDHLIPLPNLRTNSYFDTIEIQRRTYEFLNGRGRDNLARGETSTNLQRAVLELLRDGDSFYLSRDLIPAIDHAAASMPSTYVLDFSRVPEREGFVYCPTGLLTSGEFTYNGLGWYIDVDDDKETYSTIVFVLFVEVSRNTLIMAHSIPWGVAWSIGDFTSIDAEIGLQREGADPHIAHLTRSFAASLFEFMHERILVTQTKPAPRQMQRRMARQYGGTVDPVVKVIELRRREYQTTEREGDPQHRDYACQWIVRGHWRNQWYPSLDRHQPKWITPYVKGDPEKPLKIPRANVFAVIR